MKLGNWYIEMSTATRRDWLTTKQIFREFIDDCRSDPFVKIGGLVMAIIVAAMMTLPWLMD